MKNGVNDVIIHTSEQLAPPGQSQFYEFDIGDDGNGNLWWGYRPWANPPLAWKWVRGPVETWGTGVWYADSFEEHIALDPPQTLTPDGDNYTVYHWVWDGVNWIQRKNIGWNVLDNIGVEHYEYNDSDEWIKFWSVAEFIDG
jgi:hypothetical protein